VLSIIEVKQDLYSPLM